MKQEFYFKCSGLSSLSLYEVSPTGKLLTGEAQKLGKDRTPCNNMDTKGNHHRATRGLHRCILSVSVTDSKKIFSIMRYRHRLHRIILASNKGTHFLLHCMFLNAGCDLPYKNSKLDPSTEKQNVLSTFNGILFSCEKKL
jgi:hypothetical protein